MPELEFNYIYQGKSGKLDRFNVVSNQIIKETRTQNDIKIQMNGMNSSEGQIYFDSSSGEIDRADGKLGIDTHSIFTVPDVQNAGKTIPIPLDLKINLKFSFTRLQ